MSFQLAGYTFDTDALIKLKDDYPEDVFPSIWSTLMNLIKSRRFLLSEFVKDELKNDNFYSFFFHSNPNIIVKMDVEQQIQQQKIIQTFPDWVNPTTTKNKADPWIVALAIKYKISVVTMESPKKPLRIPNVCSKFNVKCINILQFFRENNLKM